MGAVIFVLGIIYAGVSLWNGEGKAVSRAAPNNGMHPTANSAAFIRKTPCLFRWMRGG